jgi:hypothetical protein
MFQFQSEFAQQNSAVILGFNIESAPAGQGDATGDVVMIVKE